MKRLAVVAAVLAGAYALLIGLSLEHHHEQPRFSLTTPIPVDADTSKTDPGTYGGRVIIGALGDPKTFNPIVASETSSTDIIMRLFSSLVSMDNTTQELIPGLAERWELSDDGLVLTFFMRRGVVWSDGIPVTAYDAAFTYEAMYDPRVENSLADIMRVNGEPFHIAVIDSFTLRVSIPSTFAPFLMWAGGAVPILPRHILQPELDAGTFDSAYNVSWPLDKLVTCGPYMLENYQPGVKTVLRRNPNYWRVDRAGTRLPYLDRVIHVSVRSKETELLMFQNGDLDMLSAVSQSDVPILERDAERRNTAIANLGASLGQNMFWFNLNPGTTGDGTPFVEPYKLAWFSDVRWRKAMAHAVDRDGIAKTVFGGLAQPQYGPETPANLFWYNPGTVHYDYNPPTAGAYLDDMGLIDRDGDGIREDAQGHPVQFTMITNTGNDQRELIGNIIKDDLAKIGVKMNFNPIEFNTMIVKIDNEYTYECCLLGLTSGDPDPSSGMSVWLSSGRMHQWHPSQATPATAWEARIDELMNLQMTTLDRDLRKKYYDEVQYIISDMTPYIYLVTPDVFVAYRDAYNNMTPTIMQHRLLWNIEEVWQE